MSDMQGGAFFSPCRLYRYTLTRSWGDLFDKPKKPGSVAFILLNPSTATETEDDPTIRRCIGFTKSWGYNSLVILNLFAIRATDPKVMLAHHEPIGADNDHWIKKTVDGAALIICAWGNHGLHMDRAAQVIQSMAGKQLMHLGPLTDQGQPRHPLYLSSHLTPQPL